MSNINTLEPTITYPLKVKTIVGIVRLMLHLTHIDGVYPLLKIIDKGYYTDEDRVLLNNLRSTVLHSDNSDNISEWNRANMHSIIHKMKNDKDLKVWVFFVEDRDRTFEEIAMNMNYKKVLHSNVVIGCDIQGKRIKIIKNRWGASNVNV